MEKYTVRRHYHHNLPFLDICALYDCVTSRVGVTSRPQNLLHRMEFSAARHGPVRLVLRFDEAVDTAQCFKQGFHFRKRHHGRPITGGQIGIFMCFYKHGRHADRHRCGGEGATNSRCPPDAPPSPPGCWTEWVASNTTG
ncbi:hypothetical protein DOFOFD_08040 [Acetobacteraceae bacterium EV16P]|uniref:Uncharacterized protein n=1 Tax=Sorlinia euscelidii TaxID=3081148 RepID=A0ABU7U258_9PROT